MINSKELPKFSHDLFGSPSDPINLVFLGSQEQIRAKFHQAGWRDADRIGLLSLLKAGFATFASRPYPTAPFTPYFVKGRVQDLSLQKPGRTLKTRHHIRIWRVGENLFAGSASYDNDFQLTIKPPFITHSIDPQIDDEREFIVKDLKDEGAKLKQYIKQSDQFKGENAFGDPYETDGRAAVLEIE